MELARNRQRTPSQCTIWMLVWAVLMSLAAGCEHRPQAPLLRDGPVYDNANEGIRFLVPDGWTQTASALLPAGDLEDEMFLVRYSLATPEPGAMLQLLVLQEKAPLNVGEHHSGPSFRVEKWNPVGERKDLEINGQKLEHYMYRALVEKREMIKEVYAFRGGDRLYSFVGLYWKTDEYASQQIARAVNTLQKRS